MRASFGLVLLAVVAAGCGGPKAGHTRKPVLGRSEPIVIRSPGGIGHWSKLLLSPDGTTYLAQWIGECETPEAFFIPAAGGKPRPVTGRRGDESIALGWTSHDRARVLLPRGACGGQFGKPGVYLVDPRGGRPRFLRAVKARPGGA